MTNSEHQTAAAHIITVEAVAMGDPEIIIMTRDDGTGAEEIERHDVSVSADAGGVVFAVALHQLGWGPTGQPTQVEPGYWIVEVERA